MPKLLILLMVSACLSGCFTRSISNSGYQENPHYRSPANPFYRGELSEFNVLGIDPDAKYSDKQIQDALKNAKAKLSIKRGDKLLVVQSGALMPDEPMIESLEKYFQVTPFTGIPEGDKNSNLSYSSSLRYSAAQAGISKMFVYWGTLESGTKNLATKTVSWVPIVGWGIPDEAQEMRIRIKAALVDVGTGQWEIFTPKVSNDNRVSNSINRESSDQNQVSLLKQQAYKDSVDTLLQRFSL